MRLSAFVAALLVSALIFSAGGPSAYALSKTNHKANAKVVTKVESKTVKVNEGDNLSTIADQNKTTFQRLFDANTKITDPNMIYPGDDLRIPAPDEQLTDRPLPADYVPPVAAAPAAAAPQAQQKATAAPVIAAPVVQSSPVSGCGDNQYANYIYSHESGCRTTASSPNGCYGIGQACPASKIAYCGADYDCQNAFFTSYAGKYGGWEGAYNFWTSHGWW